MINVLAGIGIGVFFGMIAGAAFCWWLFNQPVGPKF